MGQCHSRTRSEMDREKLTPVSPMKLQNVSDKNAKQNSSSRQEVRHQSEENAKMCVSSREHSVKSATIASPNQEHGDQPTSKFSRLNDSDAFLRQETRAGLQRGDSGHGGNVYSLRDIDKGVVPQLRSDSHSRQDPSSPDDSEYCRNKTCGSLQLGNGDKSDDVSETSMVDSISDLDISPDDVVGIIGQKHFWKARRAIANQQRVFAVQVFELHRLIKVQQLIAGSPHLLLESAYLGKPSLESSPAKKLPSDYVVKPLAHIVKRKGEPEKVNRKMECSAENTVIRSTIPSGKNDSQLLNHGPHLGNSLPAPVATDTKMGPWCFHQSQPGHQWLVPVMSPSEGLVFKPYPGSGLVGSTCGGCGPFGPTHMTGNFMASVYGVPAPHHQGAAASPGAPPFVHSYFPPYGMPVVSPIFSGPSVEQMNLFAGPGSHCHTGNLSGWGANSNTEQQNSCDLPTQKSGTTPQFIKHQLYKETRLKGSTASSPGERMQGDGIGNVAEGRAALQLFPVAQIPDGGPQPLDTDQPTRVIKVVPHNPRSATESAARIFQSIQEERKQY